MRHAMLSAEDNELLTRTGPGTPMGRVLRRYWQPLALAAELPDDRPLIDIDAPDSPQAWRHVAFLVLVLCTTMLAYPLIAGQFELQFQ